MNTWFLWTATIFGLLLLGGLFLIAWWLTQIFDRLDQAARQVSDAAAHDVHDTLHPVFSLSQLRRARDGFVDAHKNRLRLEAGLYRSDEWRGRRKKSSQPLPPSPSLLKHAREVFEAIVDAEGAWKEYVFMIEANVSVANGGDSRVRLLQAFAELLELTRGSPAELALNSNQLKVQRTNALVDNWAAQLGGAKIDSGVPDIPDIGEQIFGDVLDEEEDRDRALHDWIGFDDAV